MGLLMVVSMLSSAQKIDADYLFGPPRPYVSPRPDWDRQTCTLFWCPLPAPDGPYVLTRPLGEGGINNNNPHM